VRRGAEPGIAARRAALALLDQVLVRRRALDEALAGSGRMAGLAPRDRAFARLLATTVLRRLGQLDGLIGHCLERPLPDSAHLALNLLRLGTVQLAFLETPPHAAVETAVSLAPERFKGLINAVLRRLAREAGELLAGQQAERLNTPDWLWRSWSRCYGEAAATAVAAQHLAEPPIDLVAKSAASTWAERLGGKLLPTGAIRLAHAGMVSQLAGYDEGAWWVQDAAAALPARLLGRDLAGLSIADLCAAPGGKTAQLALAGATVVAVDRSLPRLERVAENLRRLGLAASLVEADAGAWSPGRRFDAVLLDAPCSATGTIRRHPDLPWLKRAQDLAALTQLQDRLLEAALALIEPGGRLIYSVCSLEADEGPERIAQLLARHPRLQRLPIAASELDGEAQFITAAGELRTLPCHWADRGGIDGFYAARLGLDP
jgi:16S rRNA (cytosine967-C5)-methyltransferase